MASWGPMRERHEREVAIAAWRDSKSRTVSAFFDSPSALPSAVSWLVKTVCISTHTKQQAHLWPGSVLVRAFAVALPIFFFFFVSGGDGGGDESAVDIAYLQAEA